jgi:hypothetical protein
VPKRTFRNRLAVPLGVVVLAAVGCGGNPAGPSEPSLEVAGRRVGTAILPNGYSATLNLEQSGSAVSGTMRIAGVMGETPITGNVASGDRTLAWKVSYGCEVWTGTLNIDGSVQQMSGPLEIDRTGCQPAQRNGSGTLSVDRR